MSAESKHKCLVCGRVFPDGQGVILRLGNELLEFHSTRCFSKFARRLLERVPADEVRGYIKKLREEYEELLAQRSKLKSKRI